ncbi:hypothetical protein BMS3Bbin02_00864 [bacterium BMS3Bbin02]|nr:hypothetical protein BMS3Bbin02_00864 [bacterium BMS3Bbin02]
MHEDSVDGDFVDLPCRRSEHERIPRPGLEYHFLIEFTDLAATNEDDGKQPPIWNGPRVRHRKELGVATGCEFACCPIPDDSGPKLGEIVGGKPTRHHVQSRVQ